jgi:hypothetical protein
MDDVQARVKPSKNSGKTVQARQRMVINKWVPAPEGSANAKGRFKDPAARIG